MEQKFVLVLNCGSSSIKFAVIEPLAGQEQLSGIIHCIGTPDAFLVWQEGQSPECQKEVASISYEAALEMIIALIREGGLETRFMAVGHRVVHGGEHFTHSVEINDAVLEKIKVCIPLAPLHNPANIKGIQVMQSAFPKIPHIAVFDTAFHQTLPEYAYSYALPFKLCQTHHIRRYGFHGTSHRFVTQEAAKILKKPYKKCAFISAHLGNGCSITAVLNGQSVDTSMGFTPLEGLIMGTRCGDIDPHLPTYLTRVLGYTSDQVDDLLNKKSGLLGISEIDSDMRSLLKAAQNGQKQAQLAIEMFCYRVAKYVLAYLVPLGRLDALIFTGGIGENASIIREKILQLLKAFHFEVDRKRNQAHGVKGMITKENSPAALVIKTREEWLIAQEAFQWFSSKKS